MRWPLPPPHNAPRPWSLHYFSLHSGFYIQKPHFPASLGTNSKSVRQEGWLLQNQQKFPWENSFFLFSPSSFRRHFTERIGYEPKELVRP